MHKGKALVIQCIDFRFQQIIDKDLTRRKLVNKFDRVSFPGASKDTEIITRAAEVSIRLHDPNEVLIYEHEDCGAYGQDNSETTHKINAAKLAAALKEIKPSLKVEILIATFDGVKPLA